MTRKELTVVGLEMEQGVQTMDIYGDVVVDVQVGGNNYVAILYMYWGL